MKTGKRKFVYIAVSLLAAILTWYYVNAEETVTLRVNNVPVEFLNEETVLAERGLMLTGNRDLLVDLRLQVPRNTVFRFHTDEVRVVADLASITTEGAQTVEYSVIYPSNISTRNVSIESPAVRTVSVETIGFFRKDVEVRCDAVGTPEDGLTAGAITVQPQVLEVRGAEEDVAKVSYAQVKLNLAGVKTSVSDDFVCTLYDEDGQIIKSGLYLPRSKVHITMPVTTEKEIPLAVEFEESAGARVESIDWILEPKSVTLSGDVEALATLEELRIGAVQLENLHSGQQKEFAIPVPEGFENVSGTEIATLHIRRCDISARTFTVTRFDCASPNASVITEKADVILHGTANALDAVKPEQLTLVADLSDLPDGSGVYTVPATVRVSGNNDVGCSNVYQITVRVEKGK